jgi:hypothetical protein
MTIRVTPMGATLNLPPGDKMTPEEVHRAAMGINNLLVELGHRPERITGWWNFSQFPLLGGLTPTQAWLRGDYDGVRRLVESLYAGSATSAKRIASDPERMSALRKRLVELA